ncbi:MAG: hypothetical protein R6U15_01415 [Candidatus Izemoplasmatales bacterium]
MKLRRLLLSFLLIGMTVTMVACNNMNTVEDRFDDSVYSLEEVESLDDYLFIDEDDDVLEIIEGFYILKDEVDDIVAYIYEFESQNALEDLLEEEGYTINEFGDYIYKNIFIVTLIENDQPIINAFQGR